MPKSRANSLTKGLEQIGRGVAFALRVIRDAFRAPFELSYVLEELADQGWRSLPLIVSSGLALGRVMTLHTRTELIKFGPSAWIPEVQCLSFFIEIGPLVAALLIAGRVGAGMGASLAEMRATEQIDAIEALSVDSFKLLVVPRVAACAFSGMEWSNFIPPALKTAIFGFIIGTVSCFFGYTTNQGAEGVRRAATNRCGCLIATCDRRRCCAGQDHLLNVSGERRLSDWKDTAVALDHVTKTFGDKQVLRDVTLSVPRGETICIVGRSGTGKSVTLKLIIALSKPERGHIWIDGEDITRREGQELSRVRRKMGFLSQNAALFDFLTLYDNLALPLRRLTQKSDQEIDQIIDRVLRQVGLSGDRQKMPMELSGGMKKRAGLARALVLEPHIRNTAGA